MREVLVIFYFISLSIAVFAGDKNSWSISKFENGIKIYTRYTNNSDFKEYRGITTINCSRKEAVDMVLDITNYVNWFPDCLESDIVKKIDDNTVVVYYLIDSPWPSTNRDAVVKLSIDQTSSETLINFKSVEGFKSERDDAVRIPTTIGVWKFIDQDGKTKIIYQNHADPGGIVPAWIANLFVVDAPYETLLAMKNKLQ